MLSAEGQVQNILLEHMAMHRMADSPEITEGVYRVPRTFHPSPSGDKCITSRKSHGCQTPARTHCADFLGTLLCLCVHVSLVILHCFAQWFITST